jgi:hypothetical protein
VLSEPQPASKTALIAINPIAVSFLIIFLNYHLRRAVRCQFES